MRFRKLRIAWSVVCGIACVLLVVLWVRSYYRHDHCLGPDFGGSFSGIGSLQGKISVVRALRTPLPNERWRFESEIIGDEDQWAATWSEYDIGLGFGVYNRPLAKALVIPHWFSILFSATLAAIPWIRVKRRFSLRTLLIATTLVAVVLGLVAWSMR